MQPAYIIRPARPDDLSQLNAIELAAAQAFRVTLHAFVADMSPMPLAKLEAAQSAGRLWIAANASDTPVGFAMVTVVDNAAHLHEIDVHPNHSRQGLGAQLIAAICAWAVATGYHAVTLSTFSNVPWNAPYYARLGFRPLAEAELGPELRALRAAEAANGQPISQRVCMRRDLEG